MNRADKRPPTTEPSLDRHIGVDTVLLVKQHFSSEAPVPPLVQRFQHGIESARRSSSPHTALPATAHDPMPDVLLPSPARPRLVLQRVQSGKPHRLVRSLTGCEALCRHQKPAIGDHTDARNTVQCCRRCPRSIRQGAFQLLLHRCDLCAQVRDQAPISTIRQNRRKNALIVYFRLQHTTALKLQIFVDDGNREFVGFGV